MPNMSYCMFQNTLGDLRQCADRLDEIRDEFAELSEDEQRAARRMISICRDIAEQYSETN